MSDIVERLRVGEPCAGGPDECCDKKASSGCLCAEAADTITRLTAEVERLKVESIQMQAALGYPIFAEDERHIIPLNPYRCGVCDANKHIIAEVDRLRAALERISQMNSGTFEATGPLLSCIVIARAALSLSQEKPDDPR